MYFNNDTSGILYIKIRSWASIKYRLVFGEKSSRKNGRVLKTMKKIAVINDLSGFGKCSLTAAIPVISALGLECCPMPTAVLSNQTGFESFYCDDFTDKMDFSQASGKARRSL